MGGIPNDPKLIEAWLRAKAGITENAAELQALLRRTLAERGTPVRPDMTLEELEAASAEIAGEKETTGFKRGEHGLYIEARQVKAALKESTNILFAGEKVGPTRKGARSFLAERVFVAPDELWLGRSEPDGIEMVVGHVTGAQGPRSTLGYHEYTRQSEITFDVLVTHDSIPAEWWPELWSHIEENGLGALRSQGYGKCDILAWDKIDITTASPKPVRELVAA